MSNDSSRNSKAEKPNLGSPFRVIITTLVIFFLSQLIALFFVELGYAALHPHSKSVVDITSGSVAGQFAYVLIAESLAALLAIAIVKRRHLSLSSIGLGRRPTINDLLQASVGFAIFFGVLIVAGLLTSFFPDLSKEKQDVGFNDLHGGLQEALAFISLVVLPPLGEETLMRGYLYSGLRQVWQFWPALVVTSIFFGVAHLQLGSGTALVWVAAIDTFLLSIILVFLRERTGALYAGMLVHMVNNLIAFFVVIK